MRFLWPSTNDQLVDFLERARRGDEDSFTQLYRCLYPWVHRYVRRRLLHESDAEDMTARVFHVVLERMNQFERNRGSVRAWVMTIARNALIDRARTKKSYVDLASVDLATLQNPLDVLLHREQWEQLLQLIHELDEQMQEILAMHYGDGLRYREIGEILGLSESAIKKRVSRTQRELRIRVEQCVAAKGETNYAI